MKDLFAVQRQLLSDDMLMASFTLSGINLKPLESPWDHLGQSGGVFEPTWPLSLGGKSRAAALMLLSAMLDP